LHHQNIQAVGGTNQAVGAGVGTDLFGTGKVGTDQLGIGKVGTDKFGIMKWESTNNNQSEIYLEEIEFFLEIKLQPVCKE